MKARIRTDQFQIKDQENMAFYKLLHDALVKLQKVYPGYFNLQYVVEDISKTRFYSSQQRRTEMLELSALQIVILSSLIGLNREKLESANSAANFKLLQYKDHESGLKMYTNENDYETGIESAKNYCKMLNFNPTQAGPFPYMLEIIQSDGKIDHMTIYQK